jgi:ATP-dependent helicase HrpA
VRFPEELPITERLGEIAEAIAANRVVIVAGETGSGKSTQLPKLVLAMGRGDSKRIVHTQPRRIAARSVAERVAEELGTELGGTVGYAVRFHDRVGPSTRVKVVTDGLLLAELQRDKDLRGYDTIIVDEAHERSLNIDFLLGYLRRLIDRRDDLRVIITSATIDTDRFSKHFAEAPIIEVSGRTYPVEIRYQEPEPETDQAQAICDAVGALCREGEGDILVFCSGEREIRDAADALEEWRSVRPGVRGVDEILPLYARLSSADQHRVFEPHRGRRVVLATNVAETSLTVPGIRYVVDPGTARVSRYSKRTKVQRLPIEAISQAAANQRSGRCGRLGPGICVRLYSEADFEARPAFTDPEILRTNLASVLLQMASLRFGAIESFPFIDPPDPRSIRDGLAVLMELGAIEEATSGQPRLTAVGKKMARLPVDPRFARMLIAAGEFGAVREMAIVVAALSIQDPREHPAEHRDAARQAHARFAATSSDIMSLLELWAYVDGERAARSTSQFRKLCKNEFLNVLRVREWQDLVVQLLRSCKDAGLLPSDNPASPDAIHQSLLTGLLTHVGIKDDKASGAAKTQAAARQGAAITRSGITQYRGIRETRFRLGRESVLRKSAPRWIVVADLVETDQLWGRMAAPIQPQWIERLGGHLLKRSYGEPEWDAAAGAAMCAERVQLHGLVIVAGRRVPYARVDPEGARELFIRHALAEGDWHGRHRFVDHNRAVIDELDELAARTRRPDLVVDERRLVEFYEQRVPESVVGVATFDKWWRGRVRSTPELLLVQPSDLVEADAQDVSADAYPSSVEISGADLTVRYRHDPADHGNPNHEGVVVDVAVEHLHQLPVAPLLSFIPGQRNEMVVALLRSLPKATRKRLVPIPDVAARLCEGIDDSDVDLVAAVRREIAAHHELVIDAEAFDVASLSTSLRPLIRVHDSDGLTLAVGYDVATLVVELDTSLRQVLHDAQQAEAEEGEGDVGPVVGLAVPKIPTVRTSNYQGRSVTAYPALTDEGDRVAVRLYPTPDEQAEAAWLGTRRLLLLSVNVARRDLARLLSSKDSLAVAASPWRTSDAFIEDCVLAAADHVVGLVGGAVWGAAGAAELVAMGRQRLGVLAADAVTAALPILHSTAALRAQLDRSLPAAAAVSMADIADSLDRLVYPSMVCSVGLDKLADIRRYVVALEVRLDRLGNAIQRDRQLTNECHALEAEFDRVAAQVGGGAEVEAVAWMLEEYRVSVFAQSVGVRGKVSPQRIRAALEAIRSNV